MYEYIPTRGILTNIQKRIKFFLEVIDEIEDETKRTENLDVLALAELEQMGENAKYGFSIKIGSAQTDVLSSDVEVPSTHEM